MTKQECKAMLLKGKTLDSIFRFRPGQDCMMFKTDDFTPGEEIIYIPDIALNSIPVDNDISADSDEIDVVLSMCYTGDDFVDAADGDVEKAKELFDFCDWQHPSSAATDMATWDDDI